MVLDDSGAIVAEVTLNAGPVDSPWAEKLEQLESFLREAVVLEAPDLVVVEDVHPFANVIKPVLRLQGAVLLHAYQNGWDITFVRVKEWQGHHGYVKKVKGQTSKGWARKMCDSLGYTPTGINLKEREDLRDAYLIARWAQEVL